MKSIGYLGPEGTFSHEAALVYAKGKCVQLIEYPSIPDLIYGVDGGQIDQAVVPMENSLEGTVNITVDMIVHEVDVCIYGELILPVHHCLLAKPGVEINDLRVILSHPQALAQCRKFLHENLHGIELRTTSSTAAAAKEVMMAPREWGAIASRHAARLFGLNIINENIEGHNGNSTRFVILSREQGSPTGRDKTSIVFSVDHKPGSLYHALRIFAESQINLTKIESRPMKTSLGEYLFLVDFEGHMQDDIVREALDKLAGQSKYFAVLGSYPKCTF
jgi:prephenate dehydratase